MPHELGFPEHDASEPPELLALDANTENFLESRVEPQCGHGVPSHWLERTSTSLSFWHFSQ
jgi:hypothetical protein